MLKTGRDFLNGLKDGRVVYVGGDRVEDIAAHPGFRGAARSLAALYDWKADPAQRGILSFAEDGDDYSMWFLRPRCREDLARRMRAHKLIADFSFGLFGRAPDHTGSTLTGLAMAASVFDRIGPGFGANILFHYEYSRRNDIFAAYAIVPPPGARDPDFHARSGKPMPGLRVVNERDDGVVISGVKMLATGAVYADEIWIGSASGRTEPDHGGDHVCGTVQCSRLVAVVAQAPRVGVSSSHSAQATDRTRVPRPH